MLQRLSIQHFFICTTSRLKKRKWRSRAEQYGKNNGGAHTHKTWVLARTWLDDFAQFYFRKAKMSTCIVYSCPVKRGDHSGKHIFRIPLGLCFAARVRCVVIGIWGHADAKCVCIPKSLNSIFRSIRQLFNADNLFIVIKCNTYFIKTIY